MKQGLRKLCNSLTVVINGKPYTPSVRQIILALGIARDGMDECKPGDGREVVLAIVAQHFS